MLRLQKHTDTDKPKELPDTASTPTYTLLSRASTHTHAHTHIYTAGRHLADLLPELCDGAGQVGGVRQTVVGKTFLRVPGVITALPRQLLHKKHMHKQNMAPVAQNELFLGLALIFWHKTALLDLSDISLMKTKPPGFPRRK